MVGCTDTQVNAATHSTGQFWTANPYKRLLINFGDEERARVPNRDPRDTSLLFRLAILCCLSSAFAQAQEPAGTYVTGMTVIGRPGADSSCPPIVWIVTPDTPAAQAGIRPGDRLRAMDGQRGIDAAQAGPLLRTKDSTPSTIELEGDHGPYTVVVGRIKASSLYEKQGWKLGPDGSLYPTNATDAEMQRVAKMRGEPSEKVFSVGHYHTNLGLYYPGFEVFVWKQPQPMMIGGIEDGPTQKAGVHYGDAIVSVNGVSPRGKSLTELEQLFSSPTPATMTLVVDRDGTAMTFTFQLAKASEVAEENHKRMYKGRNSHRRDFLGNRGLLHLLHSAFEETTYATISQASRTRRSSGPRERRYRPDHPQAVSEAHRTNRVRRVLVS
jgi:membrane-associated protease RseP (regulator of RpoE activity)